MGLLAWMHWNFANVAARPPSLSRWHSMEVIMRNVSEYADLQGELQGWLAGWL